MTAKKTYTKALFSLPSELAESLRRYAEVTHKKKSHIVSEALSEYIEKHRQQVSAQEAKKIFGIIDADTPDIQEIKADRDDV